MSMKVYAATLALFFSLAARAADDPGRGPGGAASPPAASGVPGAPTEVNPSTGYEQITIQWKAPVKPGGAPILGYAVTLSPDGPKVTTTDTQVVVTVPKLGFWYQAHVHATNSMGDGPESESSSARALRSCAGMADLKPEIRDAFDGWYRNEDADVLSATAARVAGSDVQTCRIEPDGRSQHSLTMSYDYAGGARVVRHIKIKKRRGDSDIFVYAGSNEVTADLNLGRPVTTAVVAAAVAAAQGDVSEDCSSQDAPDGGETASFMCNGHLNGEVKLVRDASGLVTSLHWTADLECAL